jgi:hypothetical protein
MGLLDKLLGRSKPVQPDLDQLFAVPSAAITLATTTDYTPTGVGSVCFRAAEGAAFASLEREVRALLDADQGPPVEVTQDSYGFTWIVARHDPSEVAELVTDLHAVNTTLADQGFGPQLLCSLVAFADPAGRTLGLVYLYKRGTFYPFAPLPSGQKRDNALELRVSSAMEREMPMEKELERWYPMWDIPF